MLSAGHSERCPVHGVAPPAVPRGAMGEAVQQAQLEAHLLGDVHAGHLPARRNSRHAIIAVSGHIHAAQNHPRQAPAGEVTVCH